MERSNRVTGVGRRKTPKKVFVEGKSKNKKTQVIGGVVWAR